MPEYNWITDEIFTVDDFLTAEECNDCIQFAESIGFSNAPINSTFGTEYRPDVRNNARAIVDDVDRARQLWARSLDYVPTTLRGARAVGLNERFRFYRYDVGQQFEWHRDGAFERANGERSQLTVLIYLNGEFSGGETSFDGLNIVPRQGLALFFAHPLLHKGQPVTSGRKYVLRTDVMYR